MHPSQLSGFRKTIITLLTILFAGSLLIFTGQANLDLLKSIYPNPQFYMFGLLALEGGIVYWTGYYLLHLSGAHKGIALFALAFDTLLSGVGFFYEMERTTHSVGTVPLPNVTVIIAGAVAVNVVLSLVTHLFPYDHSYEERPGPYNPPTINPVYRKPGLIERAKDRILGEKISVQLPVVDAETAEVSEKK